MKVRLTRTARITHQPGEIVEVSPAEAAFLLSMGGAEPVLERKAEAPEAETPAATRQTRTKKK